MVRCYKRSVAAKREACHHLRLDCGPLFSRRHLRILLGPALVRRRAAALVVVRLVTVRISRPGLARHHRTPSGSGVAVLISQFSVCFCVFLQH
ncbi:hypothetical protein ROHU_033319 [Labeo rohita]|uniref:Uncharacterized protein n=1 Tax=Labeo rohita TaxID=84645 RepID=A0A498LF30_LABRO|nr:hypothetical protein ROHU_033319 [Labeo rohita]